MEENDIRDALIELDIHYMEGNVRTQPNPAVVKLWLSGELDDNLNQEVLGRLSNFKDLLTVESLSKAAEEFSRKREEERLRKKTKKQATEKKLEALGITKEDLKELLA